MNKIVEEQLLQFNDVIVSMVDLLDKIQMVYTNIEKIDWDLVKEFHLKNFMPITCAIPTNPTTFISIIGEKNITEKL